MKTEKKIDQFKNLLKRYGIRIICKHEHFYFYQKNVLMIRIRENYTTLEEIIALLLGVKPAVYDTIQYDREFYLNKKLSLLGLSFVCYEYNGCIKYVIYYKEKTQFSKHDIEAMLQNISNNHDRMGKLLGFPQIVIDDFCKNTENKIPSDWVPFHYFGYHLGCREKDVPQVQKWFEKNHKLPFATYFYHSSPLFLNNYLQVK